MAYDRKGQRWPLCTAPSGKVSIYSSQACIDQKTASLNLGESRGGYLGGQGHVETPKEIQESSVLYKILLPMHQGLQPARGQASIFFFLF